ncbi:MAG: hypothetical protein R3E77_10415 [Steroidobacteraceae bacterium]
MASLTIRNLDESIKNRLRIRAAHRRRSMEEEARHILKDALTGERPEGVNLAAAIQERFRPLRGVRLEVAQRGPVRQPPKIKR